jgi:uncharacterized protein YuzE
MARMNLFDRTSGPTEFEYDAEADTLYVSFGPPRPAVGIDIGEGVVVRYDEVARRVVGLTIVGVGERIRAVSGPDTGRPQV